MTTTHAPTIADTSLMMALGDGERLAYANRDSHAVVFRVARQRQPSVTSVDYYFAAKLAGETLPDGAEPVMDVIRRAPRRDPRDFRMADAVAQVLANLPEGVVLLDRAVIGYYPKRWGQAQPEVFCYDFMSTEMLNVATWIPDVSTDGVQMQMGFQGRGRPWRAPTLANEATVRIDRYINSAKVETLPPGECTEQYEAGWQMAEAFLRSSYDPDCDGPEGPEERFNGFIARMAREREMRAEAEAAALEKVMVSAAVAGHVLTPELARSQSRPPAP